MEELYMVTKIISGNVVERRKSRISRRPAKRGGRIRGNSSEKKIEGNRQAAILQLSRILNCNFRKGDLWLTLKFDQEHLEAFGGSLDGAKREGRKFIDRMSYRMKKSGIVCKWVLAPSEIDGTTGELVRPHIHLAITGKGFAWQDGVLSLLEKDVEEIWGQGGVDVQPLKGQDDYYPLAKYIIDQARRVPDEKKYSCSRNMEKPIIHREIVTSGRQLRVPSGATELPGTRYDPERDQNVVRYVKKPKPNPARKIGGHKELARAMAAEADGGGDDDGI